MHPSSLLRADVSPCGNPEKQGLASKQVSELLLGTGAPARGPLGKNAKLGISVEDHEGSTHAGEWP